MPKFTTRVELHKATSEDYEVLHAEMEKEGFWRFIQIEGEKEKYQLLTAEYNHSGEYTTIKILEKAKSAATTTKKTFSVLVTQTEVRRQWYNLPIIK